MITVDKAKGTCEINGTGLELAVDIANDIANIVAGFCESIIEHRKPGTSKHEAIKDAKALLYASVDAGIAEALSGEESVPGGEDSNSAE